MILQYEFSSSLIHHPINSMPKNINYVFVLAT